WTQLRLHAWWSPSAQQRQPVAVARPEGHEERIEELLAGVVRKRRSIEGAHRASRREKHRVCRRRVPLAGWPEARIDIRRTLGHETDLQRAADREQLMSTDAPENRFERIPAMRAAPHHSQRRRGACRDADALRCCAATLPPRAFARQATVGGVGDRYVHYPERGLMPLDERNVDGEFAVALEESARATERTAQPVASPLRAHGEGNVSRLLGEHRQLGRELTQTLDDKPVGTQIGGGEG